MDQPLTEVGLSHNPSLELTPPIKTPDLDRGGERILSRVNILGIYTGLHTKAEFTRLIIMAGLIATLYGETGYLYFLKSQPHSSHNQVSQTVSVNTSISRPKIDLDVYSKPSAAPDATSEIKPSNQIKSYSQLEDSIPFLSPLQKNVLRWEIFLKNGYYKAKEFFYKEKREKILNPDRVKAVSDAVESYIPKDHKISQDLWAKLVLAVTFAETRLGNTDEESNAGAIGLGQFMPGAGTLELAKEAGLLPANFKDSPDFAALKAKLKETRFSLFLATFYLKKLYGNYQDVLLALTAYNGGMGTLNNRMIKPYLLELAKKDPDEIRGYELEKTVEDVFAKGSKSDFIKLIQENRISIPALLNSNVVLEELNAEDKKKPRVNIAEIKAYPINVLAAMQLL